MAKSKSARVMPLPLITQDLGIEWLGGLVEQSLYVEELDQHFQALVVLWLELPSDRILANNVIAPQAKHGALARGLNASFFSPNKSISYRPDRIRVARCAMANDLYEVFGSRIPIDVARAGFGQQWTHA